MCVILVPADRRPTPEMVERAWKTNDAGGGVAWRERDRNGRVVVRFEKGLNLEQMQQRVATMPMPFVAHFRIPSVGGKHEVLCHPFPIQRDVPLSLKGATNGNVLFHNGTWGGWKSNVMEACKSTGWKIPPGKWSDTRAMAWMAAHFGVHVLEFIDEKAVAFGPEMLEIFNSSAWSLEDGVWCSNRFFLHGRTTTYSGGNVARNFQPTGGDHTYTTPPASLPGSQTQTTTPTGGHASAGTEPQVRVISPISEAQRLLNARNQGGDDAAATGAGGSSADSPFVQAQALARQGLLSKNQLKRARRLKERGRPFELRRDPASTKGMWMVSRP